MENQHTNTTTFSNTKRNSQVFSANQKIFFFFWGWGKLITKNKKVYKYKKRMERVKKTIN